ncbi:MAG: DUF3365 domain-containing protein [Gammaproteobacteria bacterium]|nr:MAG: DUF3365 domain-containing protein [Gammaproteobacteria bacterium]
MIGTPIRRCWLLGLLLATSAGQAGNEVALLDEARRVATSVPPRLLAVLQQEIAQGGLEGAIVACRDTAPELARTASAESGWAIRRVSLRNRNPAAVPDTWERAILEEFDRRAAAGESPAALERGETVTEDGHPVFRYMRALPTQELCLGCHGTVERISPSVRSRLAALYPDDRATGYEVGDIRGAITLRRPLPASE